MSNGEMMVKSGDCNHVTGGTGRLRWVRRTVPNGADTAYSVDVLQQEHQCVWCNALEWRDVPVEKEEAGK